MNDLNNLVIIGSGPAGLTAAIYAARADLKPIVIAGQEWGGQLMGTSIVENFPGFPEGVMGPKLMMDMLKQAEKYGAIIKYESVTEIKTEQAKTVVTDAGQYQTKTVIIALGSSPRRLNIPGEKEFWGKGVSTCATCDGALYRNKIVAVIGGGDSAMEDASFISKFAEKVYLIHRKPEFRASAIMQDRVINNPKIEILYNTEVQEVMGTGIVGSIRLLNNVTNETSTLNVNGFFLAIGHIPNSTVIPDEIERDANGFVKAVNHTNTSIDGIFVAGDINDHRYQQAITAAGMGCMAALDAQKWLADN